MPYSFDNKIQATRLRKLGYSYEDIAVKLNIAKSTAFLWTKNIKLNVKAKTRLQIKQKIGQKKAVQVMKLKREMIEMNLKKEIIKSLSKLHFTTTINKLFCSLLYWAEGSKAKSSRVTFVNSDPTMIFTFLKLFRSSFSIDEKKFRGLVHIHEYHNDKEIKDFWSKTTKIPISQFNKSYLKPHTGKRIRNDYKGCLQLRYYDFKIALELKMLYNIFAKSIGA